MVVNASGVLYDDIGVSLTAVLQTVSEKENCYNRGVKIKYRPKYMSYKNRKKTVCRVVVGLVLSKRFDFILSIVDCILCDCHGG